MMVRCPLPSLAGDGAADHYGAVAGVGDEAPAAGEENDVVELHSLMGERQGWGGGAPEPARPRHLVAVGHEGGDHAPNALGEACE